MQNFNCPVCGSKIRISDTILNDDHDFDQAYRVRIDTTITHMSPMIDSRCSDLFRELVAEQQVIINNMVQRSLIQVPSQNLQGL